MTYPSAPMPPQQPPAKRKIWPWVVGGLVLLIVVAGISGNSTAGQASSVTAVAPSAPSVQGGGGLSVGTRAQAPAPAAPSGPLTTFGNGTWKVGEDVVPGVYKSAAPQADAVPLCYWDLTDDNGRILDQGVANEGPSRATLKAGRTFKSQGCEAWTKVG